MNDGKGHLTEYYQLPFDNGSSCITLADVDADGDLDAVGISGTDGQSLSASGILINNGNGVLTPMETDPDGAGPARQHALGDFDGDGDIDVFELGDEFSPREDGCPGSFLAHAGTSVGGHRIWFNTTEVGSCLDIDGDGEVGGSELTLIIGNWGSPLGDLTGDGTTNGQDLTLILANWGPCGG